MIDTKQKILDAAERLIGEAGYGATSLRHIIVEAGVNPAAIHYHFGSKEELLEALIASKIGRVNEERLARLERMEQEAGGQPLKVEPILEAFFVPMGEAADRHPEFVILMGRLMSEGLLYEISKKHFRAVAERMVAALRRAVPDIPEDEFQWRVHFMKGAIAYTMCGPLDFGGVGISQASQFRDRVGRLITFLSAGFRAPATPHRDE